MNERKPTGLLVPHFTSPQSRAMEYPYATPEYSYSLVAGKIFRLKDVDLEDRVPILCTASNMSPMQLMHKFGSSSTIHVQRALLHDHDVVFAARLTDYGAIPGMLIESKDTTVHLGIVWLTQPQVSVMDTSEAGAYVRKTKSDIALITQEQEQVTEIEYYQSMLKPFTPEGAPIGIADISSENRTLSSASVPELLVQIYQHHSKNRAYFSFNAFLTLLTEEQGFRDEISELMQNMQK